MKPAKEYSSDTEYARIFSVSFAFDRIISLKAQALHSLSFFDYRFRLICQIFAQSLLDMDVKRRKCLYCM